MLRGARRTQSRRGTRERQSLPATTSPFDAKVDDGQDLHTRVCSMPLIIKVLLPDFARAWSPSEGGVLSSLHS